MPETFVISQRGNTPFKNPPKQIPRIHLGRHIIELWRAAVGYDHIGQLLELRQV
jgi:hypothetical protein